MNEIILSGKQTFMGHEIPVVLGGFGPGKKCICDKTIAEIHGMRESDVRRRITDNIGRFRENVDYIDLKSCASDAQQFLVDLGYTQMQISKAEHIYILSERGYSKLIKIMDTDLAWQIHDQIMDEYFEMKEEKRRPLSQAEIILQQAQFMVDFERRQKEQERALDHVSKRLDAACEAIELSPNAWREGCRKLIVRIAQKMGGNEFIRDVQAEVFKLVDERAGASLETRLTNKRRRMADEGVCKSKRDKLNKIDVIADDKKLIEVYMHIVKQMAIKYGVDSDAGEQRVG